MFNCLRNVFGVFNCFRKQLNIFPEKCSIVSGRGPGGARPEAQTVMGERAPEAAEGRSSEAAGRCRRCGAEAAEGCKLGSCGAMHALFAVGPLLRGGESVRLRPVRLRSVGLPRSRSRVCLVLGLAKNA